MELLKEESGTGCKVLKNLGVDIKKMLLEAETLTKSGQENVHTAEPPNIPGARQVIEHAAEEARSLKDNYIGTGHILLALLRQSEGITARVLKAPGLKYEDVRQEIINLSGMEVD